MSNQEKIKELYFNCKYNQKEIAEELNVSTKYVSKVLLLDSRYEEEKEKRKNISKEKHKQSTKDYMKNKRKNQKEDLTYECMKHQHNQDTKELSAGVPLISNRAFRKWNASAYKYNERRKCFEFDKKLTRSYAIPKYIKF